ncbi:armadillo-type protein [Pelagophyceae sp. CCMP2097]|nr:armadillo-type protein [Pelagophyceae sp. CCMP2097]|mmetsp:Transcript_21489/g.72860  ORF Transcript_21489/g.72860 Transcript_21489/m.72860 type:complete len:753 (+) Transcript_21489:2139-4397(+)
MGGGKGGGRGGASKGRGRGSAKGGSKGSAKGASKGGPKPGGKGKGGAKRFNFPAAGTVAVPKGVSKDDGKQDGSGKKGKPVDLAALKRKRDAGNEAAKTGTKKPRGDSRQTAKVPVGKMTESVSLWNTFREKATDEGKRVETIQKALDALTGRLYEASLKHDAARVVQAMIRWGDADQRKVLVAELGPRIAELSKMPYARHVALCLLRHCGRVEGAAALFFKAFQNGFSKLATHATGAKVAAAVLKALPKAEAALLKSEFFGEEFTLFVTKATAEVATLQSVLEANAPRRERVLAHVERALQRLCDKSLVHYGYSHDLLLEYTSSCGGERNRSLASHFADATAHLVSTRAGAKAAADLVSFADVKSRKRMIKALKGTAAAASCHANAYLTLLRLLDVVDDTVASGKLLNELFEGELAGQLAIAFDAQGSKVLLWLLQGTSNTKYFDPVDLEMLALSADQLEVISSTVDLDADKSKTETDGAKHRVFASKKSAEARRLELLKTASPKLQKLCIKHAAALLGSRHGSRVLIETVLSTDSEAVANAVAKAALGDAFDATLLLNAKPNAAASHFGGMEDDEEDDDGALLTSKKGAKKNLLEEDDDEGEEEGDEEEEGDDDENEELEDFDESDDEAAPEEEEEEMEEDEAPLGCRASILEHDVAHRTLITLLQREASIRGDAPVFGAAFASLIAGDLAVWARSNRGALVLEAVLRYPQPFAAALKKQISNDPAVKKALAAVAKADVKGAGDIVGKLQ